MNFLALLLLLLIPGKAGACDPCFTPVQEAEIERLLLGESAAIKKAMPILAEASERQTRSMGANQYEVKGEWIVIRSSSSGGFGYTLDEFVKSGEFCKARGGHRWFPAYESQGCPQSAWEYGQYCPICMSCRREP